jgi:glycosyltransferase involved in cell wall biosynthesis
MAGRAPEGTGLHVAYLNYWYEPGMKSLEDLLGAYSTLAHGTAALAAEGARVTVVQRFARDEEVERGGVRFVLVRDRCAPHLGKLQVPRAFQRAARKVCAASGEKTVIHFNSLQFPLQLRALKAVVPRESVIVVQHHAEKPSRGLRGRVQAWGLRSADAFFFAASELSDAWIEQGLISRRQPVYEVMEGSTAFRRQDRGPARARTGMTGDPVVLWVGRLIALKDPLSVLWGFDLVLRQESRARLYMAYGDDTLLPAIRECLAQSPRLAASVTLLGNLPHADLEAVYNSADYFILGSHYEGSGYALAEALACGLGPVVTDIASFRALTDRGRIGALWRPGESATFAEAFLRVRREPWQTLSDRAVRFFEEQLSWEAIARKAVRAYREIAARRLVP